MLIVITYDVSTREAAGRKRLRNVAKICVNYGQRVQNSVFECLIDNAGWLRVKDQLEKEIDAQKDSLRYYYLGSEYQRKVEHIGVKPSKDLGEDVLLI